MSNAVKTAIAIIIYMFAGKSFLPGSLSQQRKEKTMKKTQANPDNVGPTAGPGGTHRWRQSSYHIPALSWNVFRFGK